MKNRIILILQTVVSLSLLAWIFRKEEFRAQIWELITTAHPGWLLAGLAVAGLGNLLGVVRWGIFLRVVDIRLSAWDVLRMSLVGLFFNNFMVGAVGGDVVKVVWLSTRGVKKIAALLSVLMDRTSGLGALVVCSIFFILARKDWLEQNVIVAHLIQGVFIYLAVVLVLLTLSFIFAKRSVAEKLPAWVPGREQFGDWLAAYFLFVARWRLTLCGMGLSFVMLMAYFFTFYCSARAFGAKVPLMDFLAIMPVVDVISALPISLGGFGVREKLFEILLGDLCGLPLATAVSISLGGALMTLIWGLTGLALLPSYRKAAKIAE